MGAEQGVCPKEVHMLKMILVAVGAIVLGFGLGFWTKSTFAERPVALSAGPTSSLSPLEMHSKLKSDDIPVQYMRGDSYY
jgi:hypothetical protein